MPTEDTPSLVERIGDLRGRGAPDAGYDTAIDDVLALLAQSPPADTDTVPTPLLTRALDEIWALRRAAAYEAAALEATAEYRTFPKSRRQVTGEQLRRLRAAARGHVHTAYADRSRASVDHSMRAAGAPVTLTRHQWETGPDPLEAAPGD